MLQIPTSKESSIVLPENYKNAWAKTDEKGNPIVSVIAHCTLAGAIAKELLKTHILTHRLNPAIYGAATHDIGKVSLHFLSKCNTWLEENDLTEEAKKEAWNVTGLPHGIYSQLAVEDKHKDIWLSRAIGAHHGWWNINPSQTEAHKFWGENQRKNIIEELEKTFKKQNGNLKEFDAYLVAGAIAVSDWIASSEALCPNKWDITPKLAQELAQEAISRIKINGRTTPTKPWQQSFPFQSFRPCQELVINHISQPCTAIIEDQTGNGKTEAALMAAQILWGKNLANGMYFGLPTTITSEKIFGRIQEWADNCLPPQIAKKLCHSKAWITEKELIRATTKETEGEDKEAQNWLSSTRKSLLAPLGVGTIDQALLATIACKHWAVRLFALCGKIVILDEIHSYDAYTNILIQKLVRDLESAGCTVLILSATLTHKLKEKLLGKTIPPNNEFPLLTKKEGETVSCHISKQPTPRRREIKITWQEKMEDCLENAAKQAESGKCVLFICNTVEKSQQAYKILKTRSEKSMGLLHSRFAWTHRQKIENEWISKLGKTGNRPNGCILIGTQILEQSLDIDSDILITELCPIDFLIQRLGRLWRHERKRKGQPQAIIFGPRNLPKETPESWRHILGKSSFVYEPYLLHRTIQALKGRNNLAIPDDTRTLLEACYEEIPTNRESISSTHWKAKLTKNKEELENKAHQSSNKFGAATGNDNRVSTRYENYPTRDVVLYYSRTGNVLTLPDEKKVDLDKFLPITAKNLHNWSIRIPLDKELPPPDDKTSEFFIGGATLLHMRKTTGVITNTPGKTSRKYTKEQGLTTTKIP